MNKSIQLFKQTFSQVIVKLSDKQKYFEGKIKFYKYSISLKNLPYSLHYGNSVPC